MAGLERSGTPDRTRVLERMRELDTRKAAAGKAIQDARLAEQRKIEAARKRRWRAERKAARGVQPGMRDTAKCESEQALSEAQKTQLFSQLFDALPQPSPAPENKVRQDLLRLSRDRKAPASARVTALRTIAEMDGHIGRLQTGSADTADQPLATMSRAQLERELTRLRAKIAPDSDAK